ncbi:hypothetical protein TWF696_005721 [Orbilia brochopaga]|uniref:Uncharacterized protein n=1 Tax=Orbilia brochopaga TaxID=3140254 RepID=A0AAV9UU37_9PEZI
MTPTTEEHTASPSRDELAMMDMCHIIDFSQSGWDGTAESTNVWSIAQRSRPELPAVSTFISASDADASVEPHPRLQFQPVITPRAIEATLEVIRQAKWVLALEVGDPDAPSTFTGTCAIAEAPLSQILPLWPGQQGNNPVPVLPLLLQRFFRTIAAVPISQTPAPITYTFISLAAPHPSTGTMSDHTNHPAPANGGQTVLPPGVLPPPGGDPSSSAQSQNGNGQGQAPEPVYRSQIRYYEPTNFIETNGQVTFRPPFQGLLDPPPLQDPNQISVIPSIVTPAEVLNLTRLFQPCVTHRMIQDLVKESVPPIRIDNSTHYVDRYHSTNLMIFAAAIIFEPNMTEQPPLGPDAPVQPPLSYSAFSVNWGPVRQGNRTFEAFPLLTETDIACTQINAVSHALKLKDWQSYGYTSITIITDSLRLLALVTRTDCLALVGDTERSLLESLIDAVVAWEAQGVDVKFLTMVDPEDMEDARWLAQEAWVPKELYTHGMNILNFMEFSSNGRRYHWAGREWAPLPALLQPAGNGNDLGPVPLVLPDYPEELDLVLTPNNQQDAEMESQSSGGNGAAMQH